MEDSGLQAMATFPYFPNKCDFPVMEKEDNKTPCDHLLKEVKRRPSLKGIVAWIQNSYFDLFLDT